MDVDRIICGDCLEVMKEFPDKSIDCCITSPPYYGLRDYGIDGQIGLEPTPEAYVSKLVEIFREVKRVLKPEGTLWLNLGDSYANAKGGFQAGQNATVGNTKSGEQRGLTEIPAGYKIKDLLGIPWMVAFALRADGWYLRSDIIWAKPNCMPESATDRPTKSHEYLFLLSKSQRYYYDAEAIKEPWSDAGIKRSKYAYNKIGKGLNLPGGASHTKGQVNDIYITPSPSGRNKRTVWTIPTKPFPEAHFATFPEKLVEPCILAGCPEGGICLDPFSGAGTVAVVAKKLGRHYVGIELNPDYIRMAKASINKIPARLDRWAIPE